MAAKGNNVRLPEDLLAELKAEAAPRELTADALATEMVRKGLREQSWQARIARWHGYGKTSGYTADQVPDVVEQWRNEQHGR